MTSTSPSRSSDTVATLEIKDLHVSVDGGDGAREILKGVDLTLKQGETHAVMIPHGSRKTTLAYSIAGHPRCRVTKGTGPLDGEDGPGITSQAPRASRLSLAM